MKILRIGIYNLNSLRGEQTIDFTESPLADHQLYAIVGPTGAGKTTILDAITLALYGQTERNKSEKDRKDGSGSVMTYGEAECRAELEYETATGRYRNVWARQRAHKKPDRDLTASRREINKWNPATEAWDLLATKKREVDTKTEEIVGLDYERFVRSVMLTQGDFARFLKSDPGDKAAILEKITGTAIYRDLSIAAFDRAKAAGTELQLATAALTSAPPLAEEERTALDQRVTEQNAALLPLKAALVRVVSQLTLHDNLRALQTKEQAAAADREQLTAAWNAAVADRERLARNDELQPFRTDLDAEVRLDKESRQLTTDLETINRETTQLTEAVTQAKATVVTAQDKLAVFNKKLPDREKKFAFVAELEREITGLVRDSDLDQKRKDATEKTLRERRIRSEQLATAAADIRKELAGMEPDAIQRQLTTLESSTPVLGTQRAELLKRIERRQLQDRLITETKLAESIGKELAEVVAAVATAKLLLVSAETELTDRQAILTNLSISQSLAEHQTNLEPGEECPVCGATEHPGLVDFVPVTDSAVERTRKDVNQSLAAQENAKRQLEAVRTKEAGLRRKDDRQRALTEELTNQLGADAEPEPETAEQLIAQRNTVEKQLVEETAEQTRLRRLQTNLPQLLTLETELAGVQQRIKELEVELTATTASLDKAALTVAEKRAKIKAEVGDHTAEECREKTRRLKEKLTAQLTAAEKAAAEAASQLAAVNARQTVLSERQQSVTAELQSVRTRLAAGLQALETTVAAARATLLPENETSPLRARLNELSTRQATAKTVGETLSREITAAKAALRDVNDRETLTATRSEHEFSVSEADRLIGALDLQIRQDDERIAAVAAQKEAIDGLRKEADRWQRLSDLIGSADGKKFRSYAQAITLQQLIAIGNDHLESINPRYRMEYEPPEAGAPERLEMIIVDRYQNDNRRTMATLSGGESFLISLALALGLSDLASGKSLIQSLFIDEGFGTLDGKTLDQAMTTLEQLQAQGKTIGLISHVPQLRERIYCQIQLERVGDGFSRIRVQG